jgi:phosphoribosylaminoimidazole-succinocarboxamide synthase
MTGPRTSTRSARASHPTTRYVSEVVVSISISRCSRHKANTPQQYLRDWLTTSGLKGKDGVAMTDEVVAETASKYREAFSKITGQSGL